MNGNTEMPTLTFGDNCTYDTLDSILNGNVNTGWTHNGVRYGWAVRVWLKQGVIVTALWGWTHYDYDREADYTSMLAWSEEDRDYNRKISVLTDDIRKVEVL